MDSSKPTWKFPDLESLAEIDAISSLQELENLIEKIFRSNDQAFIRRAILAAAANPN